MIQNSKQIIKPNEIKVSIIGLTGSGKTTFQAAFAYLLFNNTDKELKHGEPIGKTTRNYLNPKIKDLITGKFPEHTESEIQLSYRLNYKGIEYLLNMVDYDGCMTTQIHSTNSEVKDTQLSENHLNGAELKDIREFFINCNSHFIFVSADELVNNFEDAPIDKFACIYDIISYYKNNKFNKGKKFKNPIFLVVTKIDNVDFDDENVKNKITKVVKQFEIRLKEYAKNYETIFVSSIGDNFLDDRGQKLEKAELKPKNILLPIKKLLNFQELKKLRRRNTGVFCVMLTFILTIIAAGFFCFLDSRKKFDAFVKLGDNLSGFTNEQLEIKLGEVKETHRLLGWRNNFILEDTDGVKHNIINAILAELDIRHYREILDFAANNPKKIDELQDLSNKYLLTEKHSNFQKNFTAEVAEILSSHQKSFDDACWAKTIAGNTIEAYSDYISQCADFGEHINQAMQKIALLRKQNVENKWHNIEEYIAENPEDFVGIVKKIQTFLRIYPNEIVIDNDPNNLLENFILKWDEHEWKMVCEFFDKKVNVKEGNLELLEQAEKKYKNYLKLFNFRTPNHKKRADEMISLIQQISEVKKYKVTLIKAVSTGNLHEEKPDLYLKIFVNRKLVLNTKEIIKNNEQNPVWNHDFEINWKAYDKIQIELWDAENILVSDLLIKPFLYCSLFSAANVFNNPIFPAGEGKITIYFSWSGPKLN